MVTMKNIFSIQKKGEDDYISEILEFDQDDEEYYASAAKTYVPNAELIDLFSVINAELVDQLETQSEPISTDEEFVALEFMEESYDKVIYRRLKFKCLISIAFFNGEFAAIQFYTNSEQEISTFIEKIRK